MSHYLNVCLNNGSTYNSPYSIPYFKYATIGTVYTEQKYQFFVKKVLFLNVYPSSDPQGMFPVRVIARDRYLILGIQRFKYHL